MRNLIYSILRTQLAYRQAFQQKMKERKIPLSFEMLQIMSFLFVSDAVNQKDITEKSFKEKSAVSHMLKKLEKKELIRREEDQKDKRNKIIHLSEKGISLRAEMLSMIDEVYNTASKNIDSRKIAFCMEYLYEIENAFKQILNEK